ncbi:MAG: uroporphyrinogen decarboxylase family protein [Armatimonadota bacterium]
MMTGKEYVLSAVRHQATDRIPITFDAEKEVYELLHGHFGTTAKEALFDRLHVDTWMLLPGSFMFDRGEEQKDERLSIWGYGTKTVRYDGGAYQEVCYTPLTGKDEIADIKAHRWPSPGVFDFTHFPREAAAHADHAVIGVFTWGAYFIASYVRGLEDLLCDLAVNKEYAHCLIDTIADISAAALQTMLEQHGDGIDIIYMADDYCSQLAPLFSPAVFGEFVVPYLRRFVEIAHRHDKKFLLHCCGAVRPLLPMIIDAGVDMLEPLQISAEGMEPAGLKRDFGRDLCFYGGVDLQQVLCRGTGAEVADEVKRLVDILGEGGGYIIGPGHTYIQVDAPLENILSMYEKAYSYRR